MDDNKYYTEPTNPLTLGELQDQLDKAKKELGSRWREAPVRICTPYEQGIGWRYENAINAHAYSGGVDIPITVNMKKEKQFTKPGSQQ